MDVTQAVIEYLKQDPRLLPLISGGIPLPQPLPLQLGTVRVSRAINTPFTQLPAIVVSKIDDKRGNHSSTSRYSTARIQVSCAAKTDTEADEVSEMVADRLDGKVNTVMGGMDIISCFDAGMRSDDNPKIPLYLKHRDFMVKYSVRI